MAVYKCPKCSATLKPANPIPAGKKIKCPKCEQIFDPNAEAAPKPAPAKSNDDDLYAVKDEPPPSEEEAADDEEEGKKKYSLADDLVKKKIPRNKKMVAQAIGQKPSNQMLLTSSIMCVSAVLSLMVVLWPLVFVKTESPAEKAKAKAKAKAKLIAPEAAAVESIVTTAVLVTVAVCAVAAFLYNGLIAIGAVKMQSLESYRWAMLGSVLMILPLSWMLVGPAFWWFLSILQWILGEEEFIFPMFTIVAISAWNFAVGLWNLKTLRNPEVIAGFEESQATA